MTVTPLNPPFRPSDAAILEVFQRKQWRSPLHTGRPILVGLRYDAPNPGSFDDQTGALFPDREGIFFRSTTEPGRVSIDKYKHGKGVTRLKPGFYKDFFRFHFHHYRRDHPCLGQATIGDYEKFFDGRGWVDIVDDRIRHLSLHRAGKGGAPKKIGPYSEGCNVIPELLEHWFLMESIGYPPGQTVTWLADGSYRFRHADSIVRFDYALIDVVEDRLRIA